MSTLIEEVNEINDKLYKAIYIEKDYAKGEKIWNSIKWEPKILETASQVVRSRHDDKDTFLARAIVERMLIDYDRYYNGDPNQLSLFKDHYSYVNLYQSLVNKIYSSADLARIVLDGYANGGYSFLLYTLFNDNLELTEEQKAFALEEAMNKVGTTKYDKQMGDYKQTLDNKGITDDITVIAPEIGPIGANTFSCYMASVFASMDTNQAHGRGEYDIRYHILKNHNFVAEMEHLVYDFYSDDETFDEIVSYLEWEIVNLYHNEDDDEPIIYIDEILFIEQDEVFRRLPVEQATKVINEINFIKKLHQLRPMQNDLENCPLPKILV